MGIPGTLHWAMGEGKDLTFDLTSGERRDLSWTPGSGACAHAFTCRGWLVGGVDAGFPVF